MSPLKMSGYSEIKPASLKRTASLKKRSVHNLKSRVTLNKKSGHIHLERLSEMIPWPEIEKSGHSEKKL